MNRLAFGAGVLLLAPLLSGCSDFYLVNPPTPDATATPAPTPIPYPFEPTDGSDVTAAIPLNGTTGLPTSFRVAEIQDIQTGIGRANDPANATLLLNLQPLNAAPATGSATTTTASTDPDAAAAPVASTTTSTGVLIAGTKDVTPYRLAGIIVPGPTGRVGAGLQDPDEQALHAEAYRRMITAVSQWVHLTGTYASTVPATGAVPTPTTRPTRAPGSATSLTGTPAPTPPSLVDPLQQLDVYQDKQYPVDSENRPLVQVFFTTDKAIGTRVPANTKLSLNRMLVRWGWAVVDLYSPTSFDQKTWLLDEAYARRLRLGLWGLQLNGKRIALQQRVPAQSTGTGALSNVPVTNGVPITSATQSPTPAVQRNIPRVVPSSGTKVERGSFRSGKLPPASAGVPVAPAPAAGTGFGGSSSSASLNSSTLNSAANRSAP